MIVSFILLLSFQDVLHLFSLVIRMDSDALLDPEIAIHEVVDLKCRVAWLVFPWFLRAWYLVMVAQCAFPFSQNV